MPTVSERRSLTLADLLQRFGSMPAHRIRTKPPPGTATEEDLLDLASKGDRLWELVDGVLVEKAMGYYEARLAVVLAHLLEMFLEEHDLGIVLGADGASRFAPGLIRIPDVSFVSWNRLPERKIPRLPIPDLVPDLAVEVLSESNTPEEMDRKLLDYFRTGVRLVWYVDPNAPSVRVHTSPSKFTVIGKDGVLDGGDVLPGFSLSVSDWLRRADRTNP